MTVDHSSLQARKEAGAPRPAHAADGELPRAAADPAGAGLDGEGGVQLGDDVERQAGRLHLRGGRAHHPGLDGERRPQGDRPSRPGDPEDLRGRDRLQPQRSQHRPRRRRARRAPLLAQDRRRRLQDRRLRRARAEEPPARSGGGRSVRRLVHRPRAAGVGADSRRSGRSRRAARTAPARRARGAATPSSSRPTTRTASPSSPGARRRR